MSFPHGSMVKYLLANTGDTGDMGMMPVSGGRGGGGNDNLLQYSCLENHMDRGAWQATVHSIRKLDMTEATYYTHTKL